MPEYSDYTPAPWAGDSFKSARDTYDTHVGRSYDDAVKNGVTASDLVPDAMTVDVGAPIVILCDETGSMGQWPATIFSKLAYLDHEAKFYFDDDYAISFGAFGDANCAERFPVQVRPFAKEAELQKRLTELVIEGGGGGQMSESAELPALYVDRNISTPKARVPILIIITDEKCYEVISPDVAKQWCKVDLKNTIIVKELFDSLKEKWSVYIIRKPYSNNGVDNESGDDRVIREHWENLVGVDHIAFLPDAARVVDVIFGIFAKETGKIDDFRKELKDRQLKDDDGENKVEVTMKALVTIHRDHDVDARANAKLPHKRSLKKLAKNSSKSVTRRASNAKTVRSKSLLNDD